MKKIKKEVKILVIIIISMVALYLYPPLLPFVNREYPYPRLQKPKLTKAVLEHMEEKYGEKFEIVSMEYKNQIGAYKLELTTEWLKKNKMKENIWVRVMGNGIGEDYGEMRLDIQFRKSIEFKIEKLFGKKYKLFAGITVDKEIEKKLLNVNEIIESYSDNIEQFTIKIYLFQDLTEENKREYAEKILKFINYLKKLGLKNVRLEIEFYDKEYRYSIPVEERKEDWNKCYMLIIRPEEFSVKFDIDYIMNDYKKFEK